MQNLHIYLILPLINFKIYLTKFCQEQHAMYCYYDKRGVII